jgi:hypothetical protein
MMEGTGLTSSDPAFFDIAALADRTESGNMVGRAVSEERSQTDGDLYQSSSRRVEDTRTVCIVSFPGFAVQ